MNKKGCIIAVVIVLVLAALGIGGCVYFVAKKGADFGNAAAAFAVETSIDMYRQQHPDEKVPVTNEAWAEKLKDFQLPGGAGNQNLSQFIQDGKIVDIFKREVKLEEDANGKIKVISAGKDGLLDTDDDVTSELFQKLQQKAEGAAAPPATAPASGGTQ